jgi:hypothetical protein
LIIEGKFFETKQISEFTGGGFVLGRPKIRLFRQIYLIIDGGPRGPTGAHRIHRAPDFGFKYALTCSEKI